MAYTKQLTDKDGNIIYPDVGFPLDDVIYSTTQAEVIDDIIDPSSYSTTEKWTGGYWLDGKKIYKKTINTGALPNNTTKNVAHNVSNIDKVVIIQGFACSYRSGGNVYVPLPFVDTSNIYLVGAWVNGGDIVIRTGSDRSNYTESYITIYYTKTNG